MSNFEENSESQNSDLKLNNLTYSSLLLAARGGAKEWAPAIFHNQLIYTSLKAKSRILNLIWGNFTMLILILNVKEDF